MAYSDETVTSRLSSLNETQDSIVQVAQWIMFHRRHADRTAQIWLSRVQDSHTLKRLNLIYLANEVVQQSRARSKTDFLYAFEPIIADAVSIAYKGASMEVQQKLKRVVDVWRQRSIFDPNIQTTIEKRIGEIDQARGGGSNGIGGKAKLGGSLFGSGAVPPELDGVSKALTTLSRAEVGVKTTMPIAETEYSKSLDQSSAVPSPPVHAARLNSLLKSLASANSAVEGCIKAREEIVAGLEKLLQTHKSKLEQERATGSELRSRITIIEGKKKEVEDHIMQGLTALDVPAPNAPEQSAVTEDAAPPEPEAFTPPPPDVEAFTPPAEDPIVEKESFLLGSTDAREGLLSGPTGAETIHEQTDANRDRPPANIVEIIQQVGQTRSASGEIPSEVTSDPRLKRRKMSHPQSVDVDDDIFGAAGAGVDEESISALLGN